MINKINIKETSKMILECPKIGRNLANSIEPDDEE